MVLIEPTSSFASAKIDNSHISVPHLEPYEDFPQGAPPAYSENVHQGLSQPSSSIYPTTALLFPVPVPVPAPLSYQVPDGRVVSSPRSSKTYTISVSSKLSSDPEALYELIVRQAKLPPQPHVTIKGTHTQTKWNGSQGTTKETVFDFDFRIEATSTVLQMYDPSDGEGEESLNKPFRRLVVVQDRDGLDTYRGGRCKSKGR